MEKLTEPGRLYLKDYLILEEARKDMERFLNSVVDEAYDLIEEELEDLAPENFTLKPWKGESQNGKLHINFICKNNYDLSFFRENKIDIRIIYRDIRNTMDLNDPTFIKIFISSPTVASDVGSKLKNMSLEEYDINIYKPKYLKLDLDNTLNSAEMVKEEMLNKCNEALKLISFIQN